MRIQDLPPPLSLPPPIFFMGILQHYIWIQVFQQDIPQTWCWSDEKVVHDTVPLILCGSASLKILSVEHKLLHSITWGEKINRECSAICLSQMDHLANRINICPHFNWLNTFSSPLISVWVLYIWNLFTHPCTSLMLLWELINWWLVAGYMNWWHWKIMGWILPNISAGRKRGIHRFFLLVDLWLFPYAVPEGVPLFPRSTIGGALWSTAWVMLH